MVLKRSKLSAADRADIGWESPEDWEYDNETLAEKIVKLKKKQDGEVDNPPSTPSKPDLAREVAASAQVVKAKRSTVVVSPISGSRTSVWGKGLESEPILQKAIKRAVAKACTGSSPPLKSKFAAFSSTLDFFFLGLAADCGLTLEDSTMPSSSVLSVIRARELAQAKIAEATEREALLAAARAVESATGAQTSAQQENTSAVPPAQLSPMAGCHREEARDPETKTMARWPRERRGKPQCCSLPEII
jgi:hypothetical protein